MITIYHNPRCSKSRECLLFLEDSIAKHLSPEALEKAQIKTIKYMDDPLDAKKLSEIIKKLGITPLELIRTNEKIWKENYRGKNISDTDLIQTMITHPKLMERPIVVYGNKAVIGRPASRVLEIL